MLRKCADCSRSCHGRRCRPCEFKRRRKQKAVTAGKRRCHNPDCRRPIAKNNKHGFCIRCRYTPQRLPDERLTVTANGDDELYLSRISPIKTLAALLAAAEVDESVWEVYRSEVNAWTQESNRRGMRQLWQVKAWLRRAVPRGLDKALQLIERRVARHAPRYPRPRRTRHRDPHLLEFAPFDTHFGKLAWAPETGDNYDLKIAERVFANALEDILASVHGYAIEEFLFPVGQDFYHVDGWRPETFAGTPQDTEGRYPKMFNVGQMAAVRAIDVMAGIAPVRIVYVQANHDRTTAWHLVKTLEAWYRNCPAVTVETGPASRKYHRYGVCLLGLAHGDALRERQLPGLMATEVPELWAATHHHEWHLGHLHKRRRVDFPSVDSHEGVIVRVLPSLCGRDAWHYEHGYVGVRAAEAYLWSKRDGYRGHFSSNVRTGG